MSEYISVAIDGPAGAGKSTIAKRVAAKLGTNYLDTGAMYRAAGLFLIANPGAPVPAVEVEFIGDAQHTYVNGTDVTDTLRTEEASKAASTAGKIAEVRAAMVAKQREIAARQGIVMDGRDIGTVVLKDQATAKIYLTASAEVRADRRYKEQLGTDKEQPYEVVLAAIIKRDYEDMHREIDPLRPADDAVTVDSSDMDIDAVVEAIVTIVRRALEEKA